MSQPVTARPRPHLYLVKVYGLLFCVFAPLLVTRPANAQMSNPGGHWVVQDSTGKTLIPNPNDGSYALTGTVTSSASENYPGVLAATVSRRSGYNSAYFPNELFPSSTSLFSKGGVTSFGSVIGVATMASNTARLDAYSNTLMGDLGTYSAPVPVNGVVNTSAVGTLTQTWKWVPSPAPNGLPAPPFLTLLVSAPVSVGGLVNYGSSGLSSGLTNTTSASNGLGDVLNLTVTNGSPSQSLPGKHVIRFPVDPATGQATVTVAGQASVSSTNLVPYGGYFFVPPYDPWPGY